MEFGRETSLSAAAFEWERESQSATAIAPVDASREPGPRSAAANPAPNWRSSLAAAIRDPVALIDRLGLGDQWREPARAAAAAFPVVVPESYLARMTPGDPLDPLLRQVLPLGEELAATPGFTSDAVGDADAVLAPGLLRKYHGRALLIAARECAIHCRYCFRRHFPYAESPAALNDWQPALEALSADDTIQEVILSGGDPLVLSDRRLTQLITQLEAIPHLRRLRIHTRLPIVLPDRVTNELLDSLRRTRLTPIMVVHANHPAELVGDCAEALRQLVRGGITTLNQAVLLRGVNDSAATLAELSTRLVNLGVLPYYLHQLDRVTGAAHFEVPEERGQQLIAQLREHLPGYAVPQYVREVAGESSKRPIAQSW